VDLLLALLRLLAAIRHPSSPPTRVIDGTCSILTPQRVLFCRYGSQANEADAWNRVLR
jgi:hypothetical protein